MDRYNLELSVGVFVVLGLVALGYISVRLGQLPLGSGDSYKVTAKFA